MSTQAQVHSLDHPWIEHSSACASRHDYTHAERTTALEVVGADGNGGEEEESDGETHSKSLAQEDLVELLRFAK